MRPLVLVLLAAALGGCVSLPYKDTSFKAIEKPEHRAEGEERVVNDKAGEHIPGEPAGEAEGMTENPEKTAEPAPTNAHREAPTAASFPDGVQPTGRPPVMSPPEYVKPETMKGER